MSLSNSHIIIYYNILLTLWIHWGCKKNKVGVVTDYTGFAIFIIHQNCNSEQ